MKWVYTLGRAGATFCLLLVTASCGRTTQSSGAGGNSGQSSTQSGGAKANGFGGASSGAGGNGAAGAPTNVYVDEVRAQRADKIDLLFMIDNSISMADKQAVLGDAVGALLNRLVTPLCLHDGTPTGTAADANGVCPIGAPEFQPVRDIHIGVVSSSLGGHGSQTCSDPQGDDHGQLLPLLRPDPMYPIATWDKSGFLYWDPGAKGTPAGASNVTQLQTDFRNMILAVGQTGCGFESSLEGWYRFLVDPQPIISTPQVTDATVTRPVYSADLTSNPVLQQRARFLRPDSMVVVVMLSDENDCSIIDSGQGWLVGQQTLNGQSFRFPNATSVCETNPNDRCCSSCLAQPMAGCPSPIDDMSCQQARYLTAPEDALNLRCYRQKERFGVDLLYPIQRYIEGLTSSEITNRDGALVKNPLFSSTSGISRDRSLVYLVGIVGVPWQDIAVDVNAASLRYKSYADIDWDLLLGAPGNANTPPTPPGDKLMFETSTDRTQLFGAALHPVIGALGALVPSSAVGRPNLINGHETNIKRNDDLQYACIFQLPTPRPNCTGAGCDCDVDGQDYNRSVCDGSTQVYAKAYPGVRELEVLKGFGALSGGNSVVASICPKILSGSKTDPSYGYNPAISAVVDRLKERLSPRCMPRTLTKEPTGQIACAVLEVKAATLGQACTCDATARRGLPAESTRAVVLRQLQNDGYCGGTVPTSCEQMCVCEIEQYAADELRVCQTVPNEPADMPPGFCYVDPAQASDAADAAAEAALVANCPAGQKRLLRFLGAETPASGAVTMIACESLGP